MWWFLNLSAPFLLPSPHSNLKDLLTGQKAPNTIQCLALQMHFLYFTIKAWPYPMCKKRCSPLGVALRRNGVPILRTILVLRRGKMMFISQDNYVAFMHHKKNLYKENSTQ